MRLVLISFAVLAVVFYEMSGGADFEPPERPAIAAKPEPAKKPERVVVTATKPVAQPSRIRSSALVTVPAKKPKEPAPLTVANEEDEPVQAPQLTQVRTSLSQGLTLLTEPTPSRNLTLASLELGAAGLATAEIEPDDGPVADPEPVSQEITQTVETAPDLREVTGTRVNMRDGPGTIYPVVARLSIGHTVEILGDSGTGWFRLRTVPEHQMGWISASLISKSDN